jgi:hypothetical protein
MMPKKPARGGEVESREEEREEAIPKALNGGGASKVLMAT